MKKILFTLSLTALLLGSASCKKVAETPTAEGEFTAIIEKQFDTKTVLNEDLKVNWENTDKVNINGSTYSVTPNGDDATIAALNKTDGNDPESPYIAIYPASCYDDGKFVLSPKMKHTSYKFSTVPMWAAATIKSLTFRNIFAVLKITVDAKEKIQDIKVMSDLYMNGEFDVVNNVAVMKDGDADNKVTTLDCTGRAEIDSVFYIPVPAGDYSGKNFKVKVYSDDVHNSSMSANTKATVVMEAGVIYSFKFIMNANFIVFDEQTISKQEDIL